jgi:hypothetical protein
LVQYVYISLRDKGVERLRELCLEMETERERHKFNRIRVVIKLKEIVALYNEIVNKDSMGLTNILIMKEMWKELYKVTTKELQSTLKVALNKVST